MGYESPQDRLSSWYATLHGVVRAGTHAESAEDYLTEICRVLVESGSFAMALVAMHEPESRQLVVVARWGDETGYAGRIRMFTDEREEGRGPAGIASRSGVPVISNDFLNDPRTKPWHEQARTTGWRAAAVIPIRMDGASRGVLVAYGREAGFFGTQEVELLEQVADGTACVLQGFEQREARRSDSSALAAGQLRLRLASDAAGIGTFDWDVASGKLIIGGHLEKLFGFEPGTFDGRQSSMEGRVHPEDLPAVRADHLRGREPGKPISHEYRVVWPDGSVHWVLSRGEFCEDESGRLYMSGVVMDVDERKRDQEAARLANQRLRQAFDGMIEGCLLIDFNWTCIYANEAVARHGMVQRDELVGHSLLEVFPGLLGSKILAIYRECMEERIAKRFEDSFSFPGGVTRWFSVHVTPVPEGIFILSLDVTRRREAERMRQILASLVEASRDFIAVSDPDGRITYLNRAAEAMVGLDSVQRGEPLMHVDFFPPSQLKIVTDEMLPKLWKDGWIRRETKLRHFQTGEEIPVEVDAFVIRDEEGNPLSLATVTRDLRERRAAAKQRGDLEARLAQAQKMEALGRLTGGIAHDFNNALTVILGYSELLKSGERLSDRDRKSVEAIEQAGTRARDFINQLMGFSRQQVIAPQALNLNRALETAQRLLTRLVGEDVELQVIPADGLWDAMLDSAQVDQVLMNLAGNARDAMRDGGVLTIETSNVTIDEAYVLQNPTARVGDYVLLAVSDTGTGMDAETARRVFEPFFTTKEHGSGTGLGLSTVYGIVQQNHGFITLYSEPRVGSTFKLYFPRLADRKLTERVRERDRRGRSKASSATILLVEDDELVRGTTGEILRFLGYRPVAARNAAEALETWTDPGSGIDMVISDVVMPDMKGTELRDRMEEARPGVKVLFVSGYTANVVVRQGVLKPGVHFLQKPFSLEALGEKIEAVLAGADA